MKNHVTTPVAGTRGGGSKAGVDRPIILCFVAYYLPGYRSGGPARSIAHFVEYLGDEFDIRIVTSDRDLLDRTPYRGVAVDNWNQVGKARVFYASASSLTLRGISRLLAETPHDVLYLNSLFAFRFTILPLLSRRRSMSCKRPCILAPRGELSPGAIELKRWKKRPFLSLSMMLRLYDDLIWQASTDREVGEIFSIFKKLDRLPYVASNLPPHVGSIGVGGVLTPPRQPRPFRVIFLSRISPKKNLDFLLEISSRVKVAFEIKIYGPLHEPQYWQQCKTLIHLLPSHVRVEYCGEVDPANVSNAFASADLFVFPTRGENYGHVILESLAAGTPVLLSDQTPWSASGDGAVEIFRLDTPDVWVEAMERWAAMDSSQRAQMSEAARAYAERCLENSEALEQNRALFHSVLR